MPIQHFMYIPIIFLLGFVLGIMFNERRRGTIAINLMAATSQKEQLNHKTSGSRLLQMFLVFLFMFVITHMFEIPWGSKAVSQLLGGLELFDKSPVFSSSEVYERLSQFPAEGLNAYKRFTYTIDIVFPLSFLAFLMTFARFVSQRISIPKYLVNILICLPFVWFASDLIENAIILSILSKFPSKSELLASSLGFFTAIKFGLLLLSIFTPSILFIFARKTEIN